MSLLRCLQSNGSTSHFLLTHFLYINDGICFDLKDPISITQSSTYWSVFWSVWSRYVHSPHILKFSLGYRPIYWKKPEHPVFGTLFSRHCRYDKVIAKEPTITTSFRRFYQKWRPVEIVPGVLAMIMLASSAKSTENCWKILSLRHTTAFRPPGQVTVGIRSLISACFTVCFGVSGKRFLRRRRSTAGSPPSMAWQTAQNSFWYSARESFFSCISAKQPETADNRVAGFGLLEMTASSSD